MCDLLLSRMPLVRGYVCPYAPLDVVLLVREELQAFPTHEFAKHPPRWFSSTAACPCFGKNTATVSNRHSLHQLQRSKHFWPRCQSSGWEQFGSDIGSTCGVAIEFSPCGSVLKRLAVCLSGEHDLNLFPQRLGFRIGVIGDPASRHWGRSCQRDWASQVRFLTPIMELCNQSFDRGLRRARADIIASRHALKPSHWRRSFNSTSETGISKWWGDRILRLLRHPTDVLHGAEVVGSSASGFF